LNVLGPLAVHPELLVSGEEHLVDRIAVPELVHESSGHAVLLSGRLNHHRGTEGTEKRKAEKKKKLLSLCSDFLVFVSSVSL
jgi:hypothetical protein